MTTNSNPEFEEVVEEDIWVEVPARPTRVVPPAPDHPSLVGLVESAIAEGRTMVEAQIELTKIQAKASVARAGGAIVALIVVVVLALYLGWWTFHTAEVGLSYALPAWAAALITWGIILVLMIIFGIVGGILAKKAKDEAPNPKAEFEEDIAAVKDGLTNE